jgi:hypothetical protein
MGEGFPATEERRNAGTQERRKQNRSVSRIGKESLCELLHGPADAAKSITVFPRLPATRAVSR